MFIMSHLSACFYYFTARISDFDESTWVSRLDLLDSSIYQKYVTSLYWSIQTLTTVGYGDVSAVTITEKIIAILWMIVGVGFYSLTISNISILIHDLN